jgi:3-keto-5-aminohexanoate cleavage enzyme
VTVPKKLIIEVRVNEYAMRDANPHVPWSAEEIAQDAAECREAGAAIVHFHARGPAGEPAFGLESYRAPIAAIRARCDMLTYPTLGAFERPLSAQDRMAHIVQLASLGEAPDIAPMDMGSTNADRFDKASGWFTSEDRTYINSHATLRYFAQTLRQAGVKPQLVCWNLPMLRSATAFLRAGLIEQPAWIYLGLSEASLAHHPASLRGLMALVDFLPTDIRHEWTVALTGANLLPLAATAVALGGHVSIGIGDHGYPELGAPRNAELVRRVAALARDNGRELATPADAREMLGMRVTT